MPKITVLLVDIGDVIAFYDVPSFTQYVTTRGASAAKDQEFFRTHKSAYDEGTLSDEEFWKGHVAFTGVKSTPKELKVKIRSIVRVDQELLTALGELRKRGLKIVLASNIDENTLRRIKELVDVERSFDGAYFSCEQGLLKRNPEFFRRIMAAEGFRPEEALFIDDYEKNLVVAEQLGIKTYRYTNYEHFRKHVNNLLEGRKTKKLKKPF